MTTNYDLDKISSRSRYMAYDVVSETRFSSTKTYHLRSNQTV